LVCLVTTNGNLKGLPNHPAVFEFPTYVYPVTGLQKPLFGISQGPFSQAVAFDPKADLVYAQNNDVTLFLFATSGTRKAELRVPGPNAHPARQLLVHPDGKKLVMLTGSGIYHADLGKVAASDLPNLRVPALRPGVSGIAVAPSTPPPAPAGALEGTATRASLAVKAARKLTGGLTATLIRLFGRRLSPSLCWHPDGKSFFCAEEKGTLRRVSLDGFIEERRLDLGQKCSWLGVSSEGLVLT